MNRNKFTSKPADSRSYCPICSRYIEEGATSCGEVACSIAMGKEMVWTKGANFVKIKMVDDGINVDYNLKNTP